MDRQGLSTPARRVRTETARLAAALIARRDFADAARVLNRASIVPMPLKGVLVQHLVYRSPGDRLLSDVDLLVPPGRFEEALRALAKAGYQLAPEGRAAVSAKSPIAELEVDVHRRLFSPGLYGLRATDLFARGRVDSQTFGATVLLPAPHDLYAHLVGNFAKGRHREAAQPQLQDLAFVARHHELRPQAVAAHLRAHGLSRAARYALWFAERRGDRFARDVIGHLPADPLGRSAAQLARAITGAFGGEARPSLLAPHLVNRSLAAGAMSLAAHVALGARSRRA